MSATTNLFRKRLGDFLDGAAVATRNKSPSTGDYQATVLKGAPSLPVVMRVGVAGHLDIPNPDEIRAAARGVMTMLNTAFRSVLPEIVRRLPQCRLGGEQPAEVRVVSSLAAGADQLLASEGYIAGFRIHAILPFQRDEFALDIAANCRSELAELEVSGCWRRLMLADRVLELDGSRTPDKLRKAFADAASILLKSSDILVVAISREAGGDVGGTRWLKELALRADTPVISILIEEPGQPQVAWSGSDPANRPATENELTSIFRKMFLPPKETENLPDSGNFEQSFLFHLGPAYNQEMWNRRWSPAELPSGVADLLGREVGPFAVWADHRSSGYGEMARGGAILTALLGAIAVLLALLGLFGSVAGLVGKVLEFVPVLVAATWLVERSRRQYWRDRWLNYRQLERACNYLTYLALLGQTKRLLPPAHVAAHHRNAW